MSDTNLSPNHPSVNIAKTAPDHLNSTGCCIRYSDVKGRGVFATRSIVPGTVVEISPVLLFTKEEYENFGKHTALDHYTFKWRDGRMALALGLGSIFNHSAQPNVSYTIDPETDSIRYTVMRAVHPNEELCIFYGHKLWFDDAEGSAPVSTSSLIHSDAEDGWGGLSSIHEKLVDSELDDASDIDAHIFQYPEGDSNDIISECDLPFTRLRLILDEEEEELSSIRTMQVWIVDLLDPRKTNATLKWIKSSGLDDPSLSHLKRVRRQGGNTSIILTRATVPPDLPEELELSSVYTLDVPLTSALTSTSLKLKSSLWPTVYTPRRKDVVEDWTRGKVLWACEAMREVFKAAQEAQGRDELPIAAHVPVPFEDVDADRLPLSFTAHDMRNSVEHPLRHAVLNVIRAIADFQASRSSRTLRQSEQDLGPEQDQNINPPIAAAGIPSTSPVPNTCRDKADGDPDTEKLRNGSHYLLTSLTLFTTHEPCIMCSMALLHSRVKEVFYLLPMDRTGGCGGLACLPRLEGINHRFGIGTWKIESRRRYIIGLELDESVDV